MRMKFAAIAAAGLMAVALGSCETATPYQPLVKGGETSGGFTDQRLESDRFVVTFKGNDLTSRKTVENYLLYRAAELTVSQGYDWFDTVDRHTQTQTQTYWDGPYFYWRFYGGFHHHLGWGAWGPGWGPGWPDDYDTYQQFEASTEIVLHHGGKPAADPHAYDARALMANLGPSIQRPGAPKG